MSNTNENQQVEERAHANLYAINEELNDLLTELPSYEGVYYDRALARIAQLEGMLNRAAQPRNQTQNQNQDPNVEAEDPGAEAEPTAPQNNASNAQRQRRRSRKSRNGRKSRKANQNARTSRQRRRRTSRR